MIQHRMENIIAIHLNIMNATICIIKTNRTFDYYFSSYYKFVVVSIKGKKPVSQFNKRSIGKN